MQWSLRSEPARPAGDPCGRCGHGQGLLLPEYVALCTEVYLVLADSFVPAHDWCRLPAPRALLDTPKSSPLPSECLHGRKLSRSHRLVEHSGLLSYLCSKCSLQLDCQFPCMPPQCSVRMHSRHLSCVSVGRHHLSPVSVGIFAVSLQPFKAESHIAQVSLTLTI